MNIAAILHVPFEKLGNIEDWIIREDHTCTEYKLYIDPRLPGIDEFDMLIIMGGSMSTRDESEYPWLREEKAIISEWINSGKSVLGICLGAQLIASVLGSRVYSGKNKEIGWFPVQFKKDSQLTSLFPDLPKEITVFHWHGETFDLPPGAVHLASSGITPCQGFLFRDNVLALQFHCEIKPENVSLMINHAGNELIPGTSVQDSAGLASGLENLPGNVKLMNSFLNYLQEVSHIKSNDGKS